MKTAVNTMVLFSNDVLSLELDLVYKDGVWVPGVTYSSDIVLKKNPSD